jgi:hypothetical protein
MKQGTPRNNSGSKRIVKIRLTQRERCGPAASVRACRVCRGPQRAVRGTYTPVRTRMAVPTLGGPRTPRLGLAAALPTPSDLAGPRAAARTVSRGADHRASAHCCRTGDFPKLWVGQVKYGDCPAGHLAPLAPSVRCHTIAIFIQAAAPGKICRRTSLVRQSSVLLFVASGLPRLLQDVLRGAVPPISGACGHTARRVEPTWAYSRSAGERRAWLALARSTAVALV